MSVLFGVRSVIYIVLWFSSPPAQRGWDTYIVYLFDKSITKYSGPFSARQLPDKVNTIGEHCIVSVMCEWRRCIATAPCSCHLSRFNFAVQEAKTQLPLVVLKKVWGEAVSYICGLKEDYSRLFQGQRAAM